MSIQSLLPFGLGELLANYEKLELFTPKARSKAVNTYSGSLNNNIGTPIPKTNVFEDFENNRLSSLSRFANLTTPDEKDGKIHNAGIKTPDGSSIADKLKPAKPGQPLSQEQEATIKHFNQALAFQDTVTNSNGQTIFKTRQKFDDAITDLNSAIKNNPRKFYLSSVASQLQELRVEAEDGIKKQHEHEKEQITQLFEQPSSTSSSSSIPLDDIKKSMGLGTDADVAKFKQDLLKGLEKSHEAELEEFNKKMSDEITALHKAANQDYDRLNFLDIIYRGNKKKIDELAAQARAERQANDAMTLETNYSDDEEGLAIFKGVNVKDMELIKTITGREMTFNKESNTYSMELPRFGLLYYNGRDQKIAYDLTTMAAAVKACGFESITLTVNYKDEDYAMELGRKQYEAACLVGFDPTETDDPKDPKVKNCAIKIVVNGKEIPTGELFKGYDQRLATARASATKDRPELRPKDSQSQEPGFDNGVHMKQNLSLMKASIAHETETREQQLVI